MICTINRVKRSSKNLEINNEIKNEPEIEIYPVFYGIGGSYFIGSRINNLS
jgi:peptide subunit release factor RF-3